MLYKKGKAMQQTDWSSKGMKEYPFWRDDMSVEEFEIEREYYLKNFENLVQEGLYLPLWKQNALK